MRKLLSLFFAITCSTMLLSCRAPATEPVLLIEVDVYAGLLTPHHEPKPSPEEIAAAGGKPEKSNFEKMVLASIARRTKR